MVIVPPRNVDAQQALAKLHKLRVQQSRLDLVFAIAYTSQEGHNQ